MKKKDLNERDIRAKYLRDFINQKPFPYLHGVGLAPQ